MGWDFELNDFEDYEAVCSIHSGASRVWTKKFFLVSLDKIFEKTLKKNFSIIPWC